MSDVNNEPTVVAQRTVVEELDLDVFKVNDFDECAATKYLFEGLDCKEGTNDAVIKASAKAMSVMAEKLNQEKLEALEGKSHLSSALKEITELNELIKLYKNELAKSEKALKETQRECRKLEMLYEEVGTRLECAFENQQDFLRTNLSQKDRIKELEEKNRTVVNKVLEEVKKALKKKRYKDGITAINTVLSTAGPA